MNAQHRDGVGRHAEERGMTERHEAGVTDDEVQAHRENCEDQYFCNEACEVISGKRHAGERRERGQGAKLCDARATIAHVRPTPNKPCGRVSSTSTISR